MNTRAPDNPAFNSPWEEFTAEAQKDRRREPRLNLPYAVEVYGFDHAGQYFTERTETRNVSAGGCMFDLKRRPEAQGVLAIRRVARDGSRPAEHKPVLFLVCWTQKAGRHWTIGASKLQSGDMWGLSMPQEHIGN